MRRLIALMAIAIVAGCGPVPDRCTVDPTLPDCQAARASANATIAAIDSDRAATNREATRQAKAAEAGLVAQQTQAAAGAKATQIAVSAFSTKAAADAKAQATKDALEIQAMNQSLMVSATIAAINVDAARVKSQIELSTTTLIGQADIDRSAAQAQASGPAEWLKIGSLLLAFMVLLATVVYGINRVTVSVAAATETRANLVRYGYQNSRVAYRIKHSDGTIEFIPLDQILGHSNRYLTGLNVPDMAKLAAIVEADKRLKYTHAAPYLSAWPTTQSTIDQSSDQIPELAQPENLTVPSFAQLLKLWRPTADRMLFGYSDSGPLYGRLDQLLSVEIVGRQGQGKTTLLRLIYAQCLLVGVRIIVWDLHEDIVDDLPGAQTYTSAAAIEQSAIDLEAELDRRIADHDKAGTPIMALVDEINQLVNVVPSIAHVIGRVVNEGRKYKVFCIVSAKGLPATLFGGSTVRDAFSSRFAFQTTTRQAAMIGFDREVVPVVRDLTPGRALFEGPVPAQVITVPYTTAADVQGILSTSGPENLFSGATSATSTEVESHFQSSRPEVAVEVGPEVALEVASERHNQVRDLLRAKTPVSQIVRQVWGVGPGGRAYTDATAELTQIMSELVK